MVSFEIVLIQFKLPSKFLLKKGIYKKNGFIFFEMLFNLLTPRQK